MSPIKITRINRKMTIKKVELELLMQSNHEHCQVSVQVTIFFNSPFHDFAKSYDKRSNS